jgi:MoxR-like ATPase
MDTASIQQRLHRAGYVADEGLASVLWLAQALERPLLLEGDAGVGKTSVAGAFAKATDRQLVRLQCYEGLDLQQAVYEWNYGRQLLAIRLHETGQAISDDHALFQRDFLLERPLLQAITSPESCVLLIDEIDRADEAFEAYLLEVLAEYQITVPEIGTLKAKSIPFVVITSNGTRELSDALRRRCLYHFLDYPDLAREIEIVKTALPDAAALLVQDAVAFVQRLRKQELQKIPGIAETLDWVRALHKLELRALPEDPETILKTLACVLKTKDDRWQVTRETIDRLRSRASP